MAELGCHNFTLQKLEGTTLDLHITGRFGWRIRLGLWFVRLGMRIAGAEVNE